MNKKIILHKDNTIKEVRLFCSPSEALLISRALWELYNNMYIHVQDRKDAKALYERLKLEE